MLTSNKKYRIQRKIPNISMIPPLLQSNSTRALDCLLFDDILVPLHGKRSQCGGFLFLILLNLLLCLTGCWEQASGKTHDSDTFGFTTDFYTYEVDNTPRPVINLLKKYRSHCEQNRMSLQMVAKNGLVELYPDARKQGHVLYVALEGWGVLTSKTDCFCYQNI